MKRWRVVVFTLAALALLTVVWLVGGNAWAARREEQCDRAWTATFGSLDELKKKYPKRETNETAKKVEGFTRGTVLDLTPVVGSREPEEMHNTDWNRSQTMFEFLMAQIAKPEASIDPPPEEAIRFLEEKRASIDALESLLVAGPPPEWALDLSVPTNDRRTPNSLGQIRVQRILTARALAAAHAGHDEAAARSLEASWNLNESLRGRPEMMASIMGIAIARLEVGVLRKVNLEEDLWRKRLAALDSKASLLDSLVLEYRPASAYWRHASTSGDSPSWYQRSRDFLLRPTYRVMMVDYSDLMRDELAQLRGAPLSDHSLEPPTPDVRDTAHIMLAISMPNTRNSFLRTDRLVVDAELTSKILEAKHLRRENGGRWPAAIPGIETSRFPGASWRYEASPDGARISIAFSRELASPYPPDPKPLSLRFSSN